MGRARCLWRIARQDSLPDLSAPDRLRRLLPVAVVCLTERKQHSIIPYPVSETLVAMESTGHYGHALRDWLLDQGFDVHIFNPLKTNRFRDFYVQWHKNDERDAIALAHILRLGERHPYHALPIALRRLRQMVRHRALLAQARARTKNQLRAILDEVLPEYQQVPLFTDIFGITSLALLCRYPTPLHLVEATEAELSTFVSQASRGRVKADRARLIRDTACQSVVSPVSGQAYAIHRFPSSDHLVAFCGLALSESQSGQSTPRRFLSRRGSARLRKAFYQAALTAVKHDPSLGAYYRRHVRRGLRKRQAILSVARKLVRIVYAMLKSGQLYRSSTVETQQPST